MEGAGDRVSYFSVFSECFVSVGLFGGRTV